VKKWLIPAAGVAAALVAIVGTLALAGAFKSDDDGDDSDLARCSADARDCEDPNSVPEGDDAEGGDGGDALGICIEGTEDCVDTPLAPADGGAAGGTCLEGTADCVDAPLNPDEPVSNANPGNAPHGFADCGADLARCEETIIGVVTADLVERIGVEVVLVSSEYVDWPDTSLGNPTGEMFYAQVITPGFQIVLASGGQQYEYHTDTAGRFTLLD
jgi:hypothetical protein